MCDYVRSCDLWWQRHHRPPLSPASVFDLLSRSRHHIRQPIGKKNIHQHPSPPSSLKQKKQKKKQTKQKSHPSISAKPKSAERIFLFIYFSFKTISKRKIAKRRRGERERERGIKQKGRKRLMMPLVSWCCNLLPMLQRGTGYKCCRQYPAGLTTAANGGWMAGHSSGGTEGLSYWSFVEEMSSSNSSLASCMQPFAVATARVEGCLQFYKTEFQRTR